MAAASQPPAPQPTQAPAITPKCASPGDSACKFCASVPGTGAFPDTANGCTGFFNCGPSASQYVPCAPGTLFSAALGYCDWAASVVCPAQLTTVSLRVPTHVAGKGVTARIALRKALGRARSSAVGNRLVGGA